MGNLPLNARVYLIGCYALSLVACARMVWFGGGLPAQPEWLLAAALALAAGAAQLMAVSRPGAHFSDHVTPAPVFAAIVLLPPLLVALVIGFAFIPEWIRFRRRWYVQTFNISSWLLAASMSMYLMRHMPKLNVGATEAAIVILLAAMVAFVLVQSLLLGITLKLARGQSIPETGLFAPLNLLSEVSLLCMGWLFAFAWQANPVYTVPAIIPVLLVFQALNVPTLRLEASTDLKTGLLNMRQLTAEASRELAAANRDGTALSLLVCDLDLLREISNTFGHQTGDEVLRHAADAIRHSIRGCDLAARFGGDEFVVALFEVDAPSAMDVAERIRASFACQAILSQADHQPVNATISIGVASFPEHGETIDDLFREADLALFRAKRNGRNAIAGAGQESRQLLNEWKQQRTTEFAGDEFKARPSGPSPVIGRREILSGSIEAPIDLFGGIVDDSATTEEPEEPSANRRKPTPGMLVVIGSIVVLGLGSTVAIAGLDLPRAHQPWIGLALFATLVFLAHRYAADIDGRGTTSVAVVPMIGVSLLFNGPGIAVAAAVFALVAMFKAHSPIHRMLFNFGCMLLADSAALLVFRSMVHGPLSQTPYVRMLAPGLLAGLTFYLVNHLLICLIRSVAEQRKALEIWSEDYRWLWPHYLMAGLLGTTLGVTYEVLGVMVTIVMASPVALMHLAITQFIRRTTGYVNELRRLNRQLSDSYESTLQALSRALDTRDAETEEHSQRVRRYTELIGQRFGLPDEEIAHLSRGALLHDIGKIGVPDAILLKPAQLTAEEVEAMRQHPVIGHAMITHIPFLTRAAEIVLHHHESFDGSGYPNGLSGEQIPLGARIFAVVDTLDAMTSDRPYRRALSFEEALAEIKRERGRQFDPHIVDTLLALPVGELIRCRDGVVLEPSRKARAQSNLSPSVASA